MHITAKHVFLFFYIVKTALNSFKIKLNNFFTFVFKHFFEACFNYINIDKVTELSISTSHNHICVFLFTKVSSYFCCRYFYKSDIITKFLTVYK